MKKSFLMIAAALFILAGCKKEESVNESTSNNVIHIGVKQIAPPTKVAAVDIAANKLSFKWEEGDQVAFIDNDNYERIIIYTCTNPATGEFSGEALNPDATYFVGYPNDNSGTFIYRENQIPKGHSITNEEVSGSATTFTLDTHETIIHFKLKGAAKVGSIALSYADEDDYTLSCGDGVQLSDTATDFYMDAMYMDPHKLSSIAYTLRIYDTNNKELKSVSFYLKEENQGTIVDFDTPIEVNASSLPAGALSGEFSVSDDEGTTIKKVHFSQGNLYWDGDSFEFETNQYDIQSDWNPSHVSHFFWSMTASVAYDNVYNSEGENINDEFFTNATNTTAKENFTVNSVTGKYRTLSRYEWQYLLCIREASTVNGTENARCAKAVVNGKSGLIILPDAYDHPSGVAALKNINPENNKTVKFEDNSYDLTDWGKMESAGAVFLPPTGYREPGETHGKKSTPSEIWLPDSFGYYWSSSAYSYNKDSALCTEFTEYNFVTNVLEIRSPGRCVRLVTDVK